jgi:hypothetical protein
MEKLIPISKKQHDAINDASSAIRTMNDRLSLMASMIIAGCDDEIPTANVQGARVQKDGVYVLVLEIPDIAPAQADGA